MKIVFLGSGEFGLPTLRWMTQSSHEIAEIVTQPARGKGRGRRVALPPIGEFAEVTGLPLLAAEDVNAPDVVERLRARGADLGVVIAFGQKLSPEVLSTTRAGFINLHSSLLPQYRGAAPINWAILKGEPKTGVTVFRVSERMDAGRILTTRWTYVKELETAEELHDRLAGVGVDAVRAALELFSDGRIPEGEAQDESRATRAPKLRKADGVIDFAKPAREVARHVLGMWSWPGASTCYTSHDGRWEPVQLARVRAAESADAPTGEPGEIDYRFYVACADAFIEILQLKPASGRLMEWREYINGRHVQPGDRFISPNVMKNTLKQARKKN